MEISNNKKTSPQENAGSKIAPHQFARKILSTPGKKTSVTIPDPKFKVSQPQQENSKKDPTL